MLIFQCPRIQSLGESPTVQYIPGKCPNLGLGVRHAAWWKWYFFEATKRVFKMHRRKCFRIICVLLKGQCHEILNLKKNSTVPGPPWAHMNRLNWFFKNFSFSKILANNLCLPIR